MIHVTPPSPFVSDIPAEQARRAWREACAAAGCPPRVDAALLPVGEAVGRVTAESNAGDDRSAHTDSAVTRPTASPTGTGTASTRGGHPAAAHVSRHADRACSVGTSDTNGLDGVLIGTG